MNCREFIEFLMGYLDGELSSEERSSFEVHLNKCPPCKDYLATYENTIRLGTSACNCEDDLPADVPEQLVQAILAARKKGS